MSSIIVLLIKIKFQIKYVQESVIKIFASDNGICYIFQKTVVGNIYIPVIDISFIYSNIVFLNRFVTPNYSSFLSRQ